MTAFRNVPQDINERYDIRIGVSSQSEDVPYGVVTYFTTHIFHKNTHIFHKNTHIFHNILISQHTRFTTHTLHNTSINVVMYYDCVYAYECRDV